MKKTNPFSIPGDSPELLEQLVFLRRLPGKMKVKPYQQKTGEPEDMPASQGADPLTPLSESCDPGRFLIPASRAGSRGSERLDALLMAMQLSSEVVAVQSLSRVRFCDPMDSSTPGFPVVHYRPELAKTESTESVIPSNHLILCHPLLLPPSIFPSIRVFSNELVLHMRWPKYWSSSFSISPPNEHSGLISFKMDQLDLLAVQGTLKSLLQYHSSKASALWRSAFSMVQLSHPYMTPGKTIALTVWTFVGKVMSLLFNTLSRFVIAFLPRSSKVRFQSRTPAASINRCLLTTDPGTTLCKTCHQGRNTDASEGNLGSTRGP